MKTALVEAANCAAKAKGTYLRDKFYRLKAHRGYKRAAVAIAHKILVFVEFIEVKIAQIVVGNLLGKHVIDGHQFRSSAAEIPDDPELEIDLTAPQYGYSSKQQIQLEKKDDMKARGCASPDLGDVLTMTFAVTVHSRRRAVPKNYPEFRVYAEGQDWMR